MNVTLSQTSVLGFIGAPSYPSVESLAIIGMLVLLWLIACGMGGLAIGAAFFKAKTLVDFAGGAALLLDLVPLVGCMVAVVLNDDPMDALAFYFVGTPVPIGVLVLIPGAIGSVCVILASRRSTTPGHCPSCDYDLRGSQQSVNCPECGATISAKST